MLLFLVFYLILILYIFFKIKGVFLADFLRITMGHHTKVCSLHFRPGRSEEAFEWAILSEKVQFLLSLTGLVLL